MKGKIIFVLSCIILAVAFIVIWIVRYNAEAVDVIPENFVDSHVSVLDKTVEIGDKTIEFAISFTEDSNYKFGMIIYDPKADNLMTNDTLSYESYIITTENGNEYTMICKNKCKQFFSYEADNYDGSPVVFISDTRGKEGPVDFKLFNGDYTYINYEAGVTVRMLYATEGSRIMLYDAYINSGHPLFKYLRSDTLQFDADNIIYTDSHGAKYQLKIKGDSGICTFVNDYNNIKKYTIPKCFGIFSEIPRIEGSVKTDNFRIKYYVNMFRPISIYNAAKKGNMIYESNMVNSLVWELEITQYVSDDNKN